MHHDTAPARTAPLALWRVAESFLHILHALFGAPEDVAREHTLARAAYTLLLSWLRVGEALMRRLLVIEAAACPPTPPRTPRPTRQREPRRVEFFADNPEDWRVSFRTGVNPSSPACGGGGREAIGGGANAQSSDDFALHHPLSHATRDSSPANGGARSFMSVWPLAERYEALLRAFNAPIAFARRLARRLHARPQLLSTVLRAPEAYAHRVDDAEALTAAARNAWPPPDTS